MYSDARALFEALGMNSWNEWGSCFCLAFGFAFPIDVANTFGDVKCGLIGALLGFGNVG